MLQMCVVNSRCISIVQTPSAHDAPIIRTKHGANPRTDAGSAPPAARLRRRERASPHQGAAALQALRRHAQARQRLLHVVRRPRRHRRGHQSSGGSGGARRHLRVGDLALRLHRLGGRGQQRRVLCGVGGNLKTSHRVEQRRHALGHGCDVVGPKGRSLWGGGSRRGLVRKLHAADALLSLHVLSPALALAQVFVALHCLPDDGRGGSHRLARPLDAEHSRGPREPPRRRLGPALDGRARLEHDLAHRRARSSDDKPGGEQRDAKLHPARQLVHTQHPLVLLLRALAHLARPAGSPPRRLAVHPRRRVHRGIGCTRGRSLRAPIDARPRAVVRRMAGVVGSSAVAPPRQVTRTPTRRHLAGGEPLPHRIVLAHPEGAVIVGDSEFGSALYLTRAVPRAACAFRHVIHNSMGISTILRLRLR
mmetsp:Transcript_39242/g.75205  ORF Transcript_39242/g.75205 Transcript_39242/m.75205 type:complete len:421 (-) Transcript_39242:262-1524(-)